MKQSQTTPKRTSDVCSRLTRYGMNTTSAQSPKVVVEAFGSSIFTTTDPSTILPQPGISFCGTVIRLSRHPLRSDFASCLRFSMSESGGGIS